LQHAPRGEFEPGQRALPRAMRLRGEFANFTKPNFTLTTDGPN